MTEAKAIVAEECKGDAKSSRDAPVCVSVDEVVRMQQASIDRICKELGLSESLSLLLLIDFKYNERALVSEFPLAPRKVSCWMRRCVQVS